MTLNVKALKPLYEAAVQAEYEFYSILREDRRGNLDHSLIHSALYSLRNAIRLAEEGS